MATVSPSSSGCFTLNFKLQNECENESYTNAIPHIHRWILKSVGESLKRNRIFAKLQSTFPQYLLITEDSSDLTVETRGKQHANRAIKAPPPGTGHVASSYLRQDAQRTRRDLSGFLAHPNDEKAPGRPTDGCSTS